MVTRIVSGWKDIDTNVAGTVTVTEAPDTDMEGGGSITVGTSEVEVTFTATPKTIIISAANDNLGTLYIGKTGVTSAGANAITFLDAGERLILIYDDATNAVFIVASIASQAFFKGATF